MICCSTKQKLGNTEHAQPIDALDAQRFTLVSEANTFRCRLAEESGGSLVRRVPDELG